MTYYEDVRLLFDAKTKAPVGVEWTKDDGTKTRYYPDNPNSEWFSFYVESIRLEHNLSRKERYHRRCSIDSLEYESMIFNDESQDIKTAINSKEEANVIRDFYKDLTDVEKRRLKIKLDNMDYSLTDIAEKENVSKPAIWKAFVSIRQKYELYIKNRGM